MSAEAEIREAIARSGTVALDVETCGHGAADGLDPWKGEVRLLSLAVPGCEPCVFDLRTSPPGEALLRAIEGAEIIAHNARFDLLWLAVHHGIRPKSVFCTLTASRLLTAGTDLPNSLDSVLERHLGIKLPADHSTSDWGGFFLTDEQLAYAARDVAHLAALRSVLEREIRNAGLEEVSRLEMELLPVIVRMEQAGMPVDRTALAAFRDRAAREAQEAAGELAALLRAPSLNPSSPKQLQGALARVGIKVANTNESTLRAADEGRIIPAILAFRSKEKQAQQAVTFLEAIASDGRIHSHFDSTGTDTGRFSSRSPNLQNVARGPLRECFAASTGRCLISADYSQIELRAAAAIAGETTMIDAYASGADLHRRTASAILEKEAVTKEDRQIAKSANFGLIYGQGAQGLVGYAESSYGVTLTVAQALGIRTRFFAAYPALARWHDECWRLASAKASEVRTRSGRRRLIPPGADRWQRFTALVNTPVQGSCADGIKRAMITIARTLPEGCDLVSTVHDELVVEAPSEVADDVAELVARIMREEMAAIFPEVEIGVETSVSTRWAKK